jgi:hypothetical protein
VPYGKPRTDVLKALEEALASGVKVKVRLEAQKRAHEREGYVKGFSQSMIVELVPTAQEHVGITLALMGITEVSLWEEKDSPGSAAAPVDSNPPPPKTGPGKKEEVPKPEKLANALANV